MAKRSRRNRKSQSSTSQKPSSSSTSSAPTPVRSGATGNDIELAVEYSYVYTDLRAILLTAIGMIVVMVGMAYIFV